MTGMDDTSEYVLANSTCEQCGAGPGQECTGFKPDIDRVWPMLHWARVLANMPPD